MSKYPFEVQTEDVQPLSVLSPEGEIVNPDLMPELTDEQLKEIMYRMVFTRHGTSVPSLGPPRPPRLLCAGIRSGSFHGRQRVPA